MLLLLLLHLRVLVVVVVVNLFLLLLLLYPEQSKQNPTPKHIGPPGSTGSTPSTSQYTGGTGCEYRFHLPGGEGAPLPLCIHSSIHPRGLGRKVQ